MSLVDEIKRALTPMDKDRNNVLLRSGYLWALSTKLAGDDAEMCMRAARSLLAYAETLEKDDGIA